MTETRVLLEGLGFPESTRWHGGRAWLCNWGSGEVLAVAGDGEREVVARLAPQALPFSIDWLPDGRLLIIDGPRRVLLRQEPDGTLETAADLAGQEGDGPFNELVVDVAGNAYVNGGAGSVVLVRPDGAVQRVADGLQWPNGMALVDDGRTLVVADSHATQLVGYDGGATMGRCRTAACGPRSSTRPTASAPTRTAPSGSPAFPANRCVRVREGGEVLEHRVRRSRLLRLHAGR